MSRVTLRTIVLVAAAGLFFQACNNDGDGVSAPINITSSAPASASVDDLFSYQVVVDHDQGVVTYTLSAFPAGMTISSSGLVTWTPTILDLGTTSVTVDVTDGVASDSQTFDLAVDQGLFLGVGISPKGHTHSSTNADFITQYTTPDETGRVIGFWDPWRIDPGADGELSDLTAAAFADSQTFGFVPLVGLRWSDGDGVPDLTSESEPANNSWTNVETRAEFLSVCNEIATVWAPPYLALGVDTNFYWATHTPDEWTAWISEFGECYDAVKAASPDTIVLTVFQWEIMKGLGSGTTGWNVAPHFQLIDDHVATGKIDAIGFSSFPYFEYATPADIPATHYAEIAAHWDGQVFFTEIGWPAAAHPPFPGSEVDQHDFIARFFTLTSLFDLEFVGWTWQHDWDGEATTPAYAGIGLRSNDGTVIRSADAAWQDEIALRERSE
jgi:hypothetical protein